MIIHEFIKKTDTICEIGAALGILSLRAGKLGCKVSLATEVDEEYRVIQQAIMQNKVNC
jgi:ribosomal protein L11 methylase PrmA